MTATRSIYAETALLADGWRSRVRLTISNGHITSVDRDAGPLENDARCTVLLPGMSNLHSHAFQRGMAGLAEQRGARADSFWTWRETMYRVALSMTPDDVEAVAAQLYVEMLEAGFTRVGEFHYLHHDRDGRPFGDVAEMAARICSAASETGIGLTLLPVFYAHGGFGGAAPVADQRRFISSVDGYAHLLDASRRHAQRLDGAVVGVAPHSLRAVTPEQLAHLQTLAPSAPLHIHIAEQTKEVDDCVTWSRARPVQWLLDHTDVDARWCLIHATHMTSDETRRLARSGAVAGLCPITEANLGDGIVNAVEFVGAGGLFGVGSDSNVEIGVGAELRQLEYSQRLRDRARNVLGAPGISTGRALFDGALKGGAQALGTLDGCIAVGVAADLVALDAAHPAFAGRDRDSMLDAWIFSGVRAVRDVWVRGRHCVADGRHLTRERVATRFRTVMQRLAKAT